MIVPRQTGRRRSGFAALAFAGALIFAVPSGALAASGPWERTWGTDVLSGAGLGFEICTTAASCKAGSVGRGGEMNRPAGAATDAAGNVYVADAEHRRIQKFDSNGNWERTWGTDVFSGGGTAFEVCSAAASCKPGEISLTGDGGEMREPVGVATDAAGKVYVVDADFHRVERFDSNGFWERAWGKDVVTGGGTGFEVCMVRTNCKRGEAPGATALGGEMFVPSGIAANGGQVYVSDSSLHRIQKFDSNGNWERTWGKDVDAVAGGTGFEICTVQANCKAGAGGTLGGEMSNPAGVAADGSGNVFVAGDFNHRIQRFDSSGTWERAWGEDVVTGGGTGFDVCTVAADCKAGADSGLQLGGELDIPTGVTTDGSGNVYVTNGAQPRIEKYDSDGNWERAWGGDVIQPGGAGDTGTGFEICTVAADCKRGEGGQLGGEMRSASDVATGSGKVYLADSNNSPAVSNDRIQRFDSNGNWERAWGRDVIQSGSVGDTGTGFEICTTAADCQAGAAGGLAGEMNQPRGTETDGAGNVYVADTLFNRIQKFGLTGAWERAWGWDVVKGFPSEFEVCTGAAICKAGGGFGFGGGAGGQMSRPADVATDGAGNVYVADEGNSRIQKFDSNGTWERAWGKDVIETGGFGDIGTGFEICTVAADCKAGSVGGLGGEMFTPSGIATWAGKVYVSDEMNHRLQRFDSNGTFERAWGEDVIQVGGMGDIGTDDFEICTAAADCKTGEIALPVRGGEMNRPAGLETDGAGNVYVADRFHVRMQKFDSDGNWERAWGRDVLDSSVSPGTGFEICPPGSDGVCKAGAGGAFGGAFSGPRDVATDGAGKVYVVDQFDQASGNRRVQRFAPNGDWELAWGKDVVSGGGTGFEICTVAASCKIGVLGGLGGEMNGPAGATTDASGNLYLAEQGNQRIQRFVDPPPAGGGDAGGGGGGTGAGGAPLAAPPSNLFELGKLKRNKKKGIAFLIAEFPGPGEVGWEGKGVKEFGLAATAGARKSIAVSGGRVKLKIKPGKKGKRARKVRRALKRKGKAKLKVRVTYVPTGGLANTQARKVKLVKK